jgi:exonuclease VII large subunit
MQRLKELLQLKDKMIEDLQRSMQGLQQELQAIKSDCEVYFEEQLKELKVLRDMVDCRDKELAFTRNKAKMDNTELESLLQQRSEEIAKLRQALERRDNYTRSQLEKRTQAFQQNCINNSSSFQTQIERASTTNKTHVTATKTGFGNSEVQFQPVQHGSVVLISQEELDYTSCYDDLDQGYKKSHS